MMPRHRTELKAHSLWYVPTVVHTGSNTRSHVAGHVIGSVAAAVVEDVAGRGRVVERAVVVGAVVVVAVVVGATVTLGGVARFWVTGPANRHRGNKYTKSVNFKLYNNLQVYIAYYHIIVTFIQRAFFRNDPR